jgi:hypothetical protein
MAVLHHYLVRLRAYKALGTKTFLDYIILGDDVVIFNSVVAKEYAKLITLIGVQISKTKTVSPSRDADLVSSEFASKLVVNGIDISPLPIGLFNQGDLIRTLRFHLRILERAYRLGGAALSESLLRCIPSWLDQAPFDEKSDFKAPPVRED